MTEQQYREARRRHPELDLPAFLDLKAEAKWIITRKRFTRRHLISARAAALLGRQHPSDNWLSWRGESSNQRWSPDSPSGFDGIAPKHPKRYGYLMGLDPAFGYDSTPWRWRDSCNL